MFTLKEYVSPDNLEEAYYLLNKNRNNVILGGTTFLRMGNKRINTAIDLKNIPLNYIEKRKDGIAIGANVTFRQVEINPLLNDYYDGIISESISNIIGVQFRNMVVVGSAVYARYGFADILLPLLAVNAKVKLYHGGIVSLESFLKTGNIGDKKDILVEVILPLESGVGEFTTLRNSASDFAILNTTVTRLDNDWRIVVGGRPGRAILANKAMDILNNTEEVNEEVAKKIGEMVSEELTFGTNMRGTKEYRKQVSSVMVKRNIISIISR